MAYLIDSKTGEILFECAGSNSRAMTKAIMRYGFETIVCYDGQNYWSSENWLVS